MTSQSHRVSFFLRNQRNLRLNLPFFLPQASSPRPHAFLYLCLSVKSVAKYLSVFSAKSAKSASKSSVFFPKPQVSSLKPGLSLVELLIAIGIMGVTMVLIGAAFPAGVAMSIAVSDETTSQAVFQKALTVIRDNYSLTDGAGPPGTAQYDVIADLYLGKDGTSVYNADVGLANRVYEIAGQPSNFSWSAMIRRMAAGANPGPMGNLCQVVVVASRQKYKENAADNPILPELQSVDCTAVSTSARTMTMNGSVPNGGYIIDEATGTAYIIVSRNEAPVGDPVGDTVTVLSEPPSNAPGKTFWMVPGPSNNSKSPSIRVFQAMLYLP